MAIKARTEESAVGGEATGSVRAPALPASSSAVVSETITQTRAGIEAAQTRMEKGMDQAMKTVEEFVTFGRGNVEAMMQSGQIWATGLQDLGKQVAATAQAQFEGTMSAFKALAGARSMKDAFELQTTFARTTFEKTLAESGRLTESSIKLTEQALAPVTARVSLAVEKFGAVA